MGYDIKRYNEMVEATFAELRKLAELKGGEYSGDTDRLANFRRNGLDQELPMETIWRVYAAKHWDAIGQYIIDIRNGKQRVRLESIAGRADDLIVYLLLFKAMVEERAEPTAKETPSWIEWNFRNAVMPVFKAHFQYEIKLADGSTDISKQPELLNWKRGGVPNEIVAYRVYHA